MKIGLHTSPKIVRWELLCLAAILLLDAAFLLRLVQRTGVTVDEPSHILSAILYWEGDDKLPPHDMPPLIKIVGGWAAAGASFRIPHESLPVWRTNHEWNVAQDMILRMTEREIRSSMAAARTPLLVFPLATAVLLWWWSRQLFSRAIALTLAALFVLEPTAMGHGPLFKNDHAATFGFLFFWFRAWRFWVQPSLSNAAAIGFAATLAMLAKLSMLILPALAPFLIALKWRTLRRPALALAAVILIPYVLSIAACQFEVRPLARHELHGMPRLFRTFRPIPVPIPLWQGFASLLGNASNANAVYFLGKRHDNGSRAYFAVAAAVKAPEIILLLLAFVPLALYKRKVQLSDAFWLTPGLLYFTLASVSNLQLGFRLVLPCLPFALLAIGSALQFLPRGTPALALAAAAASLASIYPHNLSYFNVIAGGPTHALRYLSDSNVDWGQDLRNLRAYLQRRGNPKLKLAYFGLDRPDAYFPPGQIEPLMTPFAKSVLTSRTLQPSPGIYAISATLLTGQFFDPSFRDYFKAFRDKRPTAYAGYSIYIFDVP